MVLADGMGGHHGGAEASRLAVSAFVETFPETTGGVAARLRVALTAANEAVGRFAAEHVDLSGMGCTLVACVVTGDEAVHWISVGDSPLWRLRVGGDDDAGGMDRLNADHSMRPVFENLVRLGRMTTEDAEGGAVNQLRSAVTGEDLALVDAGAPPVRLGIGDRILLASDGLEALSEEEIYRLSGGLRPAGAIVSDLLEAVEALDTPSQDNATAVVYRHLAAGAVGRRFDRLTAPTLRMARRR